MSPERAPAPARPELRAAIGEDPLEPARLLEGLGGTGDGGVVLFVGRVRAASEGRRVVRLRYEAYMEMAEEELMRIVAEVAERHRVGAISVAHRVGTLEPGEPSVAVAVAAPHRAAAYEASRAVMEGIKARLPVWKKEEYADGSARWLGAPAPPARRSGTATARAPATSTEG